MKKIFPILMFATAFSLMGCSGGDEEEVRPMVGSWRAMETVSQAPNWQVTKGVPKGSVPGRPEWQWNDQLFRHFSKDMTAILALDSEGVELASPDDRMAAIVGGQVRFIAEPIFDEMTIAGEVERFATFYLYIPFETGEDAVDIQYYNAKLNHTTVRKAMFSVNDDMVGNEELVIFYLYPKTYYNFELAPNQPFTSTADDRIAIYAESVCCGIVTPIVLTENDILWPGHVYDDMASSSVYVRYYSAQQNATYTTQATPTGQSHDSIVLDFNI